MTNPVATSKLLAAAAATLVLQACAMAPNLDARFGDTVNSAKAQQTLNPDASRNRNVVAGLDGKAAQEAMVRYRDSFKTPPPAANVFTIGVGGGQ